MFGFFAIFYTLASTIRFSSPFTLTIIYMAQQDRDHHIVLKALQAAGWTITHPNGMGFSWDEKTGTIDIGAEMYIAEKGTKKIAVEVKNYPPRGKGVMASFDRGIGQYQRYASYLRKNEPDRTLYKAVPRETYNGFLSKPTTAEFLKEQGVKMFVYDPDSETIEKWIE